MSLCRFRSARRLRRESPDALWRYSRTEAGQTRARTSLHPAAPYCTRLRSDVHVALRSMIMLDVDASVSLRLEMGQCWKLVELWTASGPSLLSGMPGLEPANGRDVLSPDDMTLH